MPEPTPSDPTTSESEKQPEPAGAASEPEPPVSAEDRQQEIGDFITRHVLEKDSVFFEG